MPFSPKQFLERISSFELTELSLQGGIETDPITGQPKVLVGFAISLGRKTTDRHKASQLILYLDDFGVLYERPEWEFVAHSITSVITLRNHLGKDLLPNLTRDTAFFDGVRRMRDACKEFQRLTSLLEKTETGMYAYEHPNYRRFDMALARFRREFGRSLLELSIAYDIEVTDNLSQIIKFSPNFDETLVRFDE